ncbi:hypothetical protein [Candidatus Lucifugimonas marina]|jgi:myo-inositol catabolism protein IolC|uniref:Uncharacterized protein n=1 Tax=Candidatus Lucifugimonas marina TaxID=3038979 RepID=A0AAJ5ZGK4_9CHLR|nr:hypothetical protein [SAR202 cluster bacterium JH702]MDG0869026.1 hypothetical protein [SAR202 cluster bacterium JH639]WFG35649.1 hypothetical protein GKN94_08065 [SAR202 cluster bacterium JH545]WFG39596.1 hypothetical protein GKO48_08180 [SAR202 cluster bacterium JH1073]
MASSIYNSNLHYIVALDDRVDLCADVLASSGEPTAADREQAAKLKRIVFDGMTTAVENGLAKSSIGVWADSDIGESVLLRAKAMSMATASSPGNGTSSLGRLNLDYTAVQLTLNPDGPTEARKELLKRLKVVSDKAREESTPLMIEIDSVPTATQIQMYGGFSDARSMLILMAIQQLQDAGVDPAIWSFEPENDPTFVETIAAQAQLDDREVSVFLSIAGELSPIDAEKSPIENDRATVKMAATTPGITGVFIGPRAYFGHLVQFNEGNIKRDEAVEVIANHLNDIGGIFEKSYTPTEAI